MAHSVLITGANRGIGKAMADLMADRGDAVTRTARQTDGHLALDVADPQSVKSMAESFGTGPLDLLVCNAGVFEDRNQALDDGFPPEMWAQMFAINVTGAFLCVQALLPNLRAARGKIALISSQLGSSAIASGGSYIYRSSKAALLNLGRNLAVDLKSDGIAVGTYHPGWVQTDMGGTAAAITAEASAEGLVQRFDALSLKSTGCFETYDGSPHPF